MQNAIMFLCTLSVLVGLVMAQLKNNSAQRDQTQAAESRVARIRYSVSQEIRNQVPVDFAAMNLRKSRTKSLTGRSTSRHRTNIDKAPKASAMEKSSKQPKRGKHKSQTRKKLTDKKIGTKKSSWFRMDRPHVKSSPNPERPPDSPLQLPEDLIESTDFDKNTFLHEKQPTINSNASTSVPENDFANINKAINALPQQLVKIVRDDVDCNDDPTEIFQNTRGSPCTFSLRWPRTGGHPPYWMNNIYSPNWELFY